MSENLRNGSGSSSSSLSSSFHDTEDDQTIANMLAEDETRNAGNRQLGKRLSHLDSIPVCICIYVCMNHMLLLLPLTSVSLIMKKLTKYRLLN